MATIVFSDWAIGGPFVPPVPGSSRAYMAVQALGGGALGVELPIGKLGLQRPTEGQMTI